MNNSKSKIDLKLLETTEGVRASRHSSTVHDIISSVFFFPQWQTKMQRAPPGHRPVSHVSVDVRSIAYQYYFTINHFTKFIHVESFHLSLLSIKFFLTFLPLNPPTTLLSQHEKKLINKRGSKIFSRYCQIHIFGTI